MQLILRLGLLDLTAHQVSAPFALCPVWFPSIYVHCRVVVRLAGVAVSFTASFPYDYQNIGIPSIVSAQYAVGTILLEQPVASSEYMLDGCTPMTVSSRIVVAATAEIPDPFPLQYPIRRLLSTSMAASSTTVTDVLLHLWWRTDSGQCILLFDTAVLTLIDDDGVILLANETVYNRPCEGCCAVGPVSLPEVRRLM